MATLLTKPMRRTTEIGGRIYIVSLLPATEINRLPSLEFRQHKKRRALQVPLESVLYHAAERQALWEKKEKQRLRKLRQSSKE